MTSENASKAIPQQPATLSFPRRISMGSRFGQFRAGFDRAFPNGGGLSAGISEPSDKNITGWTSAIFSNQRSFAAGSKRNSPDALRADLIKSFREK